ncbi:MAG: hypothetical protein Q4D33_12620 [Prevotellaceae bacterium]|nr:hypothetical protein [Prevotellaceae bacterium]
MMKKDIKALLEKVEAKLVKGIHERPSKDTLDHLAIFAGFQDWDSFREEMAQAEEVIPDVEDDSKKDTHKNK